MVVAWRNAVLHGSYERRCHSIMRDAGFCSGRKEITTIEGLSENNDHPVQKAWMDIDVAQCGYCQTGQIMTAAALLRKKQQSIGPGHH
jgi:aerobic-type carbon monoxide dehydrogenase small subunit (CoxS/CutS family)